MRLHERAGRGEGHPPGNPDHDRGDDRHHEVPGLQTVGADARSSTGPTFVEVDLNLTCFIRGDIVMNPGQIDFGIVRRSEKMPPASLTLTYAGGRSDWEVTKMKTQTSKVKAELRELSRTADGQINYALTATLQPGVPNGYFKDEITLITNDQSSPSSRSRSWPTSRARSPSPRRSSTSAAFRPGQTVSKTVLVRSAQPFSITRLSRQRGRSPAGRRRDRTSSRPPVEADLKAPEQTGPHHATLTIETDIKDEPPARSRRSPRSCPDRERDGTLTAPWPRARILLLLRLELCCPAGRGCNDAGNGRGTGEAEYDHLAAGRRRHQLVHHREPVPGDRSAVGFDPGAAVHGLRQRLAARESIPGRASCRSAPWGNDSLTRDMVLPSGWMKRFPRLGMRPIAKAIQAILESMVIPGPGAGWC